MNIEGSKIKALIEVYGRSKDYPEKSYLPFFCRDFDVNYTQWNAYTRGKQNLGTKIFDLLIDIFPSLNLNWLLKDEGQMFTTEEINAMVLTEPKLNYERNVTNLDLMQKLEEMHLDLKKMNKK
ncbi:MAG: hypothetical protein H7Y10_12095 [Flavobacterium sp.]|nr:hypothetical protein [Flavobacterium sp.]